MSSTVSPNIQNLTSKSHVQIASRPVRFPLTPAINVTHPRNSTVLQPLIFLSSTPKVLLSALTWPAQHVTAYVESHPERRWLTQSVADDMMLKSYKGRRIPQPEFECAENEPRAVIIRRQVELRTDQTLAPKLPLADHHGDWFGGGQSFGSTISWTVSRPTRRC